MGKGKGIGVGGNGGGEGLTHLVVCMVASQCNNDRERHKLPMCPFEAGCIHTSVSQ